MDTEGGWQYIAHHEEEGTDLFVPLPDGKMAAISHLAVKNAQKTLGVTTCPSGNSAGSLNQTKDKAKKWFNLLTAGRLHCQMMWFSVDCQMWPLFHLVVEQTDQRPPPHDAQCIAIPPSVSMQSLLNDKSTFLV